MGSIMTQPLYFGVHGSVLGSLELNMYTADLTLLTATVST